MRMRDGGARSAKACLTEALPIQDANAFEVNLPRPDSEVNVTRWFLGLYPCSEIKFEHQDRRVCSCRSRGLQNEPRVVSTHSSLRPACFNQRPVPQIQLTDVCVLLSLQQRLLIQGGSPARPWTCLSA
jgi:hypothetical protein